MGCMISIIIFIILLSTGILSYVISALWSVLVYINDNPLIVLLFSFVICVLYFAICESLKKSNENMVICRRLYSFIIYDSSLFFYKEEKLNYDRNVLEYIQKEVEQDINRKIYKFYIEFYSRISEKIDFNNFLKEHGKIFIGSRNADISTCSVISDKKIICSIVDRVTRDNADNIQKLENIIQDKISNFSFDVVDLDIEDDVKIFYSGDFICTYEYLNKRGVLCEDNRNICSVYNELINNYIDYNVNKARINKNNPSREFYMGNISDIVAEINKTFTSYLELVLKNVYSFREPIFIRVNDSISFEDIERQILNIENIQRVYSGVYDDYMCNKNIKDYFKYVFKRFPAPFWSMNDIDFDIEYDKKRNILIIDSVLPNMDSVPVNINIKSINNDGGILYTKYGKRELYDLYNDFVYQYIMAIVYYAFECDSNFVVNKLVVNCRMQYIEKSTGRNRQGYVASVAFNRDEYFKLNFSHLDAKECFIYHNGISSGSFKKISPISPITLIYSNKKNITEKINLTTMHWRGFEKLIRVLLEKTYEGKNYNIELTRASRDGGVDIIVHDYDPINGGVILVQVKRYSHIVGIEAVRALYGILDDYGAMKGILITTAHFGTEARNFVKNKPVTLIDGESLIQLLDKFGFSQFYITH